MAGEAASTTPQIYEIDFEDVPEATTPAPVHTPGWWKDEVGFRKAKKREDTNPERNRDLYEPFFKYWRERDLEEQGAPEAPEHTEIFGVQKKEFEDYELNVLTRARGNYQPQIGSYDSVLSAKELAKPAYKYQIKYKGARPPTPTLPEIKLLELELEESVLTYGEGLRRTTPGSRYYGVMEDLGYGSEEMRAEIVNYEEHECPHCDKKFYYPRVQGGRWNPFIAYDRSRSAALRTYRMLEGFNTVCEVVIPEPYTERDYNRCELEEPYLFEINVTYPKELSRILVKDKKRYDRVTERTLERFLEEIRRYVGAHESGHQELGTTTNKHPWKSTPEDERGDFTPEDIIHLHHHIKLLTCTWNAERQRFEYFKPKLFKPIRVTDQEGKERIVINLYEEHLEHIKDIWSAIIKDTLEREGIKEEAQYTLEGVEIEKKRDVFVQFIPLSEKKRVIHALKYASRSFVVDLDKWCEQYPTSTTPEFMEQVKQIRDVGGFVNKAEPRGFWRHFKKCVELHVEHAQEIIDQAIRESGSGYLDDRAQEIREEIIDRELLRYRDVRLDKRRVCPLCEGNLIWVGEISKSRLRELNPLAIELNNKMEIRDIWRPTV